MYLAFLEGPLGFPLVSTLSCTRSSGGPFRRGRLWYSTCPIAANARSARADALRLALRHPQEGAPRAQQNSCLRQAVLQSGLISQVMDFTRQIKLLLFRDGASVGAS